jgi:hypothetical protein
MSAALALDDLEDEALRHCLLCGRPTTVFALFIPNDPVAAGLGQPPAGKTCVAIYGLCLACFALPEKAERVETIIQAGCN